MQGCALPTGPHPTHRIAALTMRHPPHEDGEGMKTAMRLHFADDVVHTSAFSPRENARVLLTTTLDKKRAQGMPGARCTRSLACKNNKAHEVVTTGSPEQSGIPRAMVLTVFFGISPVIGLSCHRRQQVTTCQLDASVEASGPHDFAVRVSAVRQKHYERPPHPAPTSVTIAKR